MKHNIYLTGFMGTGKSTVSSILAESLGFEEIDTDEWIEKQQNREIKEIFALHGEAYFRDLETGMLERMQKECHKVISCGGGMVLRKENISLMKKNGLVVLLTASPDTIFSRVNGGLGRPVLNGNMNVGYIKELLEKRRPYYEAAGEVVIGTDGRNPEEISEEIKEIWNCRKKGFDF